MEWKPSYKRGTVMQASLAVIGSLLTGLSWWLDKNAAWLIGGIFLFAVVPFTLIVMFPTNKKLESGKLVRVRAGFRRAGGLVIHLRRNATYAFGANSTQCEPVEFLGLCNFPYCTPISALSFYAETDSS
jgi:Domain of unknown function (DUF1772)